MTEAPSTRRPRNESTNYDVAIIGYGPTGATAANLLGGMGLKVLVIERDPDVYNRARAISIDEEVLRVWQSAGLAERLQRDMLPGLPITFVGADGKPFFEWVITPKGSGHPAQQFIYQPAVDAVLREGVERFANVEILMHHECLRVVPKGNEVELMLADLTADTFKRVRASYVIAAEGGSSPTRGQLGIGYSGRTYAERWIVIDTKVIKEWDEHDRLRFHCKPTRPTVDCPTPLGHHRWEFPIREHEDEQKMSSHEEVWKILNAQGITEGNVEILRSVVYSHHVRCADRWRVGRIFLAGDAAHAMPPWLGQGMSAGVRDAANLCWKLAAVVRGQAPDSLLDTYQTERQPHVTEITRRAVRMGWLITEHRISIATIRDRGAAALTRRSQVVDLVQKYCWIPDARHARGFLHGKSAAVGRQLPQPWVLAPTGSTERLDDALGNQWTVLHTGPEPVGSQSWKDLGVPAIRLSGPDSEAAATANCIRDTAGTLVGWFKEKKAAAVIVRPDGFVYGAAGPGQALPRPPARFTCSPARTATEPNRMGISA